MSDGTCFVRLFGWTLHIGALKIYFGKVRDPGSARWRPGVGLVRPRKRFGLIWLAMLLVLAPGVVRADSTTHAGADVPLVAHVDAGDPAPFTGDLLNTAAERNLLAQIPDAGAPAQAAASPSSAIPGYVWLITCAASVAAGAYWAHKH